MADKHPILSPIRDPVLFEMEKLVWTVFIPVSFSGLLLARKFDCRRSAHHVRIGQHSPTSIVHEVVLPMSFFEDEVRLEIVVGQNPPFEVPIVTRMIK